MLALDPGNERSALIDYRDGVICDMELRNNEEIARILSAQNSPFSDVRHVLVIEMVESYGMRVGKDVFQTCVWIGRFIERFGGPCELIHRSEVKLHLCGTKRAKDADVRQALIDMYGDSEREAIGLKKSPGPLYGVVKDLWSALGVAVTYDQTRRPCDANSIRVVGGKD